MMRRQRFLEKHFMKMAKTVEEKDFVSKVMAEAEKNQKVIFGIRKP